MKLFKRNAAPEQPPKRRATLRLAIRNIASAISDRLFSDWATSPLSADAVVSRNLRALRARSRDQLVNNDYVKRYVKLLHTNVVGPKGVTLRAMARGSNGDLDESDNEAIEKAWNDWCRKKHCDVSGKVSFVGMQKLAVTGFAIEGEFLARKVKDQNAAGYYGFALQLIDPETLNVDHNESLSNGRFIKMGIEFDTYLRPVAYYLLAQDQTSNDYTFRGRKYIRVPAEEMIHCFDVMLIGQKRGLPAVGTALARMKMLAGYEDAAITAARAGASKMGFFKQEGSGEYTGDDEDESGNIISDFEAGTFELLPEGVSFEAFNPDYPHQQHDPVVKGMLRGASAGFNISYFSLANDLEGVNYTSSRTGLLEDREHFKELQEWLIESLFAECYEEWLGRALALGRIVNRNGVTLPRSRLEKYLEVSFAGRRWSWVDPQKEAAAAISLMEAKVKSRKQVIREIGGDPAQVDKEIESDPNHPEPKNTQPMEQAHETES